MNNENQNNNVVTPMEPVTPTTPVPSGEPTVTETPAVTPTPVVETPVASVPTTEPISTVQTPVPPTMPTTPVEPPVSPSVPNGPEENKKGGSKVVLIIVIILVIAALAVGAYFLFFKDKDKDGTTSNSNSSSNTASNTNSNNNYQTVSLETLSTAFNNLSVVKEYNTTEGYNLTSSVSGNTFVITITMTEDGNTEEVKMEGTLEGNTLTFKVGGTSEEQFAYAMMFMFVVDAKATVDGIKEEEALLGIGQLEQPTLAANGYEIKETTDGADCSIDLSKKISLPDISQKYITVEDLEDIDEIITSESGFASGNVGLMAYSMEINQNGVVIAIAEPKSSTEKTYNSLLAFVEKLYGQEELNNFKTQYPKLENKTFGNYTITLNPQGDNYKEYYDKEYAVVELTIKK